MSRVFLIVSLMWMLGTAHGQSRHVENLGPITYSRYMNLFIDIAKD